MADSDLESVTGLALALMTSLIERSEPVPKGEVARYLRLLAETASPFYPGQRDILNRWAQLMETGWFASKH